MFARPIDTESIDDGLDRKSLYEVKQRFLALNQSRMQRVNEALNSRQQLFLDLLPLLLHINHPMLPGYLSRSAPAGIALFSPSKEILQKAKQIARSFRFNPLQKDTADIEAIFCMGSLGTIAYTRRSDLDIWICHRTELSKEEIRQLAIKNRLLMDWAKHLGVNAQLYLMNADKFRQGENLTLSREASGNTQHNLLLDEFYRSAIHVAGKLPLWWFVPTARERDFENYSEILLARKYLPSNELIDFGNLPSIPADEVLTAGLWQLYKALESPYKSLIKLILLESYANLQTVSSCISLDMKNLIYCGKFDADDLDPYLMSYRRIEHYLLERREIDRLQLVRQALYLKTGIRLSKTSQQDNWKVKNLNQLVQEWRWTQDFIVHLDKRNQWSVDTLLTDYKKIQRALLYSYEVISALSNDSPSRIKRISSNRSSSNVEVLQLKRAIAARVDTAKGKVSKIQSDFLPNEPLVFTQLHYSKSSGDQTSNQRSNNKTRGNWQLFKELASQPKSHLETHFTNSDQRKPVYQTAQLVHLLAWALQNNFIDHHTHIEHGEECGSNITNQDLDAVVQRLSFLSSDASKKLISLDAFKEDAQITHVGLFANLGAPPFNDLYSQGLIKISDASDVLNFGEQSISLINSLDIVIYTSWQETFCYRFTKAPLLEVTRFLGKRLLRQQRKRPAILVSCSNFGYGASIEHRLKLFFQQFLAFIDGESNARIFSFQEGGKHYQFNRDTLLSSNGVR